MARYLEPHAEQLADAADIRPGMDVADIAAGNGNFDIAAARRGTRVIASDLTPKMIALGRARRATERLTIDWQPADAEQLPFAPDLFDVAASVFGAMFAPRPNGVAAELFRVVKPGGRVAMANYSNAGFLGRFTALLTKFSLAPPGGLDVPSPFMWGDAEEVRRRFGGNASSLRYQQLRGEGAGLMRSLNGANDGSLVLDSDYLSVIARKAS